MRAGLPAAHGYAFSLRREAVISAALPWSCDMLAKLLIVTVQQSTKCAPLPCACAFKYLPRILHCAVPIAGITSENVAAQFGVSRDQQDAFAARSHALAAAAQVWG